MLKLNLLNDLGKEIKCEACRAFYLFFSTSLTNSIIQEHEVLDSIETSLKSHFCLSILLHDVISLPGATSYRVSCMINIDTISMKLTIVHFKGSQVEFSKLWCIYVPLSKQCRP